MVVELNRLQCEDRRDRYLVELSFKSRVAIDVASTGAGQNA